MKETLGRIIHKKTKFPTQTVDVNTTADFGVFQPMQGCFPLVPNSTLKIRHRSFVRLHQLPFPTFGRLQQRTYHYFVPIADIYHPFESMLAAKPYNGSNGSYIPTSVPTIELRQLAGILLMHSDYVVQKIDRIPDENHLDFEIQLTTSVPSKEDIVSKMEEMYNLFGLISTFGSELHENTARGNIYITPNNADYVLYMPIDGSYWAVSFRLNQKGQNLRKFLIGNGYQITRSEDKVSILPLIACAKCYFDYWLPKRDYTWKDTKTFHLMEYIEQTGETNSGQYPLTKFYDFIKEVRVLYYYQNPDYYTGQFSDTAHNSIVSSFNTISPTGTNKQIYSRDDTQAVISSSSVDSIGWAQVKALEFLTKFINKNTAIGGRIDEYLKVHYGAKYVQRDTSYEIGCDVNDVQISDVMSTADTASASLGEYAGKGLGYSEGQEFTIKTDTFGYYICLSCVVPKSRFSQGIDPNIYHKGRFDFYLGAADGLTLVPTRTINLFTTGASNVDTPVTGGFGYAPIYTEWKMRPQNIVNGDFNRNGSREYMGYYMDKRFTENYVEKLGDLRYRQYLDGNHIGNVLSPTINLRRLNDSYMTNFNRIFFDSNSDPKIAFDHVISHNVFEFDLIAPMLPYADSFDTDAFKDGLKVEKA